MVNFPRRNAQILPHNILEKVLDHKTLFYRNFFLFIISYISCIITPINLWIVQQTSILNNSPVITGLICDLLFFFEFLYQWNNKYRHHVNPFMSNDASPNKNMLYICNLISLLPLLILLQQIPHFPLNLTWFLLPRMLRLKQLYVTFLQLQSSKEFSFLSNGTVTRIIMIILFGSIHASLLACLWFYISCSNRNNCPQHNAWVAYDSVLHHESILSSYLRSLYFITQTLFTIGYGDVSPQNDSEIIFTLFLIFNGSLFYGFLISSITSLLSNKDVEIQRYRSELSLIRRYLDYRNISPELRYRIEKLFNYLLLRQGGMMESQFLQSLPSGLTHEIMNTFTHLLQHSSFFEHQNRTVLYLCVQHLQFRTHVPNSIILFQNERKREIIFIRKGRVDIKVQTSRNSLFSCMSDDVLGEFEFFFGTPSPITAEISIFSEILILKYEIFYNLIKVMTGSENIDLWLSTQQPHLNAVIENHKKFLSRIIKVRLTIEDLQKKRKMIEMMASITEEEGLGYVISPESIIRPIWSMMIIIGTIYFMLMIPFRILGNLNCHLDHTQLCLSRWDWTLLVDYLLDLLFLTDVILNSFLFAFLKFESQREVIVTERREIFEQFKKSSRAWISVFGIIPIDFFSVCVGWILCLRVCKLIWILLLFENIQNFLNYFEKYREKTLLSPEGTTVLYLSITSIFAALYMAIIWCLIHHQGSYEIFVEGLYFCLTTMTTVGYGDIVPTSTGTTLYVVCLSILGPSACATIIANAASYMINTDSSIDNIAHRMTVIQTFIKVGLVESDYHHHHLHQNTKLKITDTSSNNNHNNHNSGTGNNNNNNSNNPYLNYIESIGKDKEGIDEEKVLLTMLPDYLHGDIKQFMTMDLILNSKFFRLCDTSFLREVMLSLELHYLLANKVILYPGLPASGMYLVHNGTIQISTAQGRKTVKLSKGDSFGEIFLFEDTGYCNFRAESSSNCEVWYLCRTQFLELLSSHDISTESATYTSMSEYAKESCRTLIETPLPSRVALLAIQELRAITNDNWISIRPDSFFYHVWIILLVFISILNIFWIPFGIAFVESNSSLNSPIIWLQYLGDLIHILDILMRLFWLGYWDQDQLILSRSKITTRYTSSSPCWTHVIAAIPLDLLLFCGPPKYGSVWQTLMMCRINKFIRLIDIPKYFNQLEKSFFSTSNTLIQHTMKLVRLIFIVFIAAHIAGCLFFIVAHQQHVTGHEKNWADYAGILRSCEVEGCQSSASSASSGSSSSAPSSSLMMTQYIHAIYWATGTLTTVGYGDIFPISITERLFCMIIFFIGTSVYTMVVTCLQDIVANLDVTSDIYKNRYDRIHKLLLRENCSEEIKKKSTLYLEKLWNTQRGAHGDEIKHFLSTQLYAELNQQILKKKFEHLFYFKQSSVEFQLNLFSKLEIHHYLTTDFLFHNGEAALSLYFLISGEIALVSEDSGYQYFKIFSTECSVGESEFFTKSCYCCAGQVTRDVMCYELSYTSFWTLIEQYQLQNNYKNYLNLNFISLWKTSTQQLVKTFHENLKNVKMTKMLTIVRQEEKCGYHITPNSIFSWIWSVCTMVWIVYTALTVPFCLAFLEMNSLILLLDGLQSLFFFFDLYLNIRYFSIEVNGILIKDWKIFSSLYLESHFKFDLLSTLPLGLILYGLTSQGWIFTILRVLYFFRYSKLNYHTNKLISLMESFFDYRLSSNSHRMLLMIVIVWYFGHLACCCLCFLGKISLNSTSSPQSWLIENEINELSLIQIYLRGYLWAMYTIVTVGYGNIQLVTNLERIFAVCVMLSGAILCDAGVTAVLSSLIGQADKQNATMRRIKQATLAFCHSNQLNEILQDKIISYFDYVHKDLSDCIELEDYKLLPKPLSHELIQSICYDALCSLCLIDLDSSEYRLGFVYSMIRYVTPTLAIPGQVLLQVDNDENDIHILRKGKVYTRFFGIDGYDLHNRDYFQVGEVLCHGGNLHTTNAISPGKLIQVIVGSLQPISITPRNISITSSIQQSSAFMSSTYFTKLSCGARKARSSNKSCNSKKGICWKETFNFHVPRAVTSLQLSVFDEKQRESGGCIGYSSIVFKELESLEQYQSSHTSTLPQPVSVEPSSQRYHPNNPSRSASASASASSSSSSHQRENNSQSTNTTTTTTNENEKNQPSSMKTSYHVKKDIRDKNGQLKGFMDVQISIKSAGLVDETINKRKSEFLKNRKLSTKPAEIVCESFCHLFTIEGHHLAELKKFYRNHLRIGKNTNQNIEQRRNKKKYSFCQATLLHAAHNKSNQPSSPSSPYSSPYPSPLENNLSEEKVAVLGSCLISSSSESSSIRRRFPESSLVIPTIGSILKSNLDTTRKFEPNERSLRVTQTTPAHEHQDEVKNSSESVDEDDSPLSLVDISEQEFKEALGISSLINDINRGGGGGGGEHNRSEFRLSWR